MSDELNDIIEKIKKNIDPSALQTEVKENIFSKFLNFKLSISLKSVIRLFIILVIALYIWKLYNAVECKINIDFPTIPSLTSIESKIIKQVVKPVEETKIVDNKKNEIKLVSVDDTKVILSLDGGSSQEVRTEGSVSWRNNNPGLIYYGDFARSVGAIGSDGKYAIFATYDDGKKAQENLLFESKQGYKDKSLDDALKLYAPKNEGFNTDYYINTIKQETSINSAKVLSTFTSEERKSLLNCLEQIERFKQGKVEIK